MGILGGMLSGQVLVEVLDNIFMPFMEFISDLGEYHEHDEP